MGVDRAVFLAAVRASPLGGSLAGDRVTGMEAIPDGWERRKGSALRSLAGLPATTQHGTPHAMQPVEETGATADFTRMYDIEGARPAKARELGNVQPGDGARLFGRSLVQLTGRTNVAVAGNALAVDRVGPRSRRLSDGSTPWRSAGARRMISACED